MKLLNALLTLYPREWRARYEEEFTALLEQNPLSLIDLGDIALGALDAHLRPQLVAAQVKGERRLFMNRASFIKWSGMAGMVGSVLPLLGLIATSVLDANEYPYNYGYDGLDIGAALSFFASVLLTLIFAAGLAISYGRQIGLLGQTGLLVAFVGLLSLGFSSIGQLAEMMGGTQSYWWLFFVLGMMGLLGGSALFCLAGSMSKVLPSVGSKLAMFAGFSALAILLLSSAFVRDTASETMRVGFITAATACLVAFTAGLFLLGYGLWSKREPGLARIEPAAMG